MKTLKLLVILGLLIVAAKLAYLYSGAYDFGADAPHWPATEEIIELARERSIETRIGQIQVPKLDDPALIAEGAAHYGEMCMACHLAPGFHNSALRLGLYPQPPRLTEPDPDGDPREAFWAIKHGIKLTGMPAWGKSHDDEEIWAIVAFLKVLPTLTPEQYKQMTETGAHEHDDEAESGHEHGGDHDHGAAGDDKPEAAVDAFLDALAAGKAEEAAGWLAPDVLVYESGGKEGSRDEYVAQHLKADIEFLSKATTERLERAVNGGDETAWVTSRSRIRGHSGGKPADVVTDETMVLTRGAEGWRIRHIHWSSRTAK